MPAAPTYRQNRGYGFDGRASLGDGARAAYVHGSAAPELEPRYSRPVHVQPASARGFVEGLDPRWQVVARVVIAIAAILFVAACVRVQIVSATVQASQEYQQVAADIETARAQGSALEVQASNLSSPGYVKDYASQRLGMHAPATVETLTLGSDVVVVDEGGALSLSQSLAAVARR